MSSPPEPADSPSEPAGEIRELLLARFEAYLDEALAGPDELDDALRALLEDNASLSESQGEGRDLYSLWSALTALTQEVALQGRGFKQLTQQLGPLAEHAPMLASVHETLEARIREQSRQARESAQRELLEVLLDLREVLLRGQDAAQAQLRPGSGPAASRWPWSSRRNADEGSRAAVRSLLEGYALGLARLDEALERMGVAEVGCLGRSFDPHHMRALDLDDSADAPPDTVLEVYRRGYVWRGAPLRTAQVKVARALSPRSSPPAQEDSP